MNSDANPQLDIAANGFWEEGLNVFDVRVFNPGAPSNQPFKSVYCHHEREKRCQCEQRVCECEYDYFTLLVFISSGRACDAASHVYRRLANLLSEKDGSFLWGGHGTD